MRKIKTLVGRGLRIDTQALHGTLTPGILRSTLRAIRIERFVSDVPAHIYTFSFEPNPNWSSFYANGLEIWDYIRRTTTKYGLDEKVQFHSRVIESIWDESSGKWNLTIDQNGTTIQDSAEILVNGSGILNKWKWPEIEGLKDYKGELLHSARWNENFDCTGKSVAVIGNGSSAIQIVPQIQPAAMHITNYIRSPTWVTANFCPEHAKDGKNFNYTEEEKRRFREHPEILHKMRKEIEHSFNQFFFVFLNDTKEQEFVHKEFKQQMEQRLDHDPELIEKLIPDWKIGCRRITPGEGYLEALQAENVTPEFRGIDRIVDNGIRTADGKDTLFDAIICATGFDVSFCPSWKLVGRDERMLAKDWKEDPEAYFGICAAGLPNYFMFNGPNCPVGHGSLLAVMEWTAEYILRWCNKIAAEDIQAVCVRDDAVREYNIYSQEFLKRTVWSGGCRSWYKNGKVDGKVTAMYAGSILHYKGTHDKVPPTHICRC